MACCRDTAAGVIAGPWTHHPGFHTLHSGVCRVSRIFNLRAVRIAGNVLVVYVITRAGCAVWRVVWRTVRLHGVRGALQRALQSATQTGILIARWAVPAAERRVRQEVNKAVGAIEKDLVRRAPGQTAFEQLPARGMSRDQVVREMERTTSALAQLNWRDGRVSGAVYHGGSELHALEADAFRMFTVSNPLHPDVFPAVRRMEAEVVRMVLSLFHGDAEAVGNMTSGGTESILLACLAYRELGRRRGITAPEIIAPVTVHAAFDKAAAYFGMALVHVPVDPATGKVDVRLAERAVTRNTVLLVGSAPNFPHGTVDDIPALAAVAVRYGVPLHVDCCLGGFLVPFAGEAGFPLPHAVDFAVPGVTSISADTHKYGYAPKGSSVIMYRRSALRRAQYFVTTDWPGGVYATPTLAGSRPGALIAGCWAAMLHLGRAGYVDATRRILGASRQLAAQLGQIPQLRIVGTPLLSVVAFAAADPEALNIYALAELLHHKRWHLNVLQNPPAIHIAVTMVTCETNGAERLVRDIEASLEAIAADPSAGNGAQAAIYGTAATVPDRTIVADVAVGFLDALTKSA